MHFQIAKRIKLHHNDIAMEIHHNDIAMELHHNDITMEIHHNDIAMEVHHNDIAREWFCVYITVRKTKTILRYFFSSYINTQDGSRSNLTPAISRVLTGRHLILAHPCDQRAVTRLENIPQLNIKWDKKLSFQLSHKNLSKLLLYGRNSTEAATGGAP